VIKRCSADYIFAVDALQVNVASYCALTPQYKDLVQLYEQFHADGLEVNRSIIKDLTSLLSLASSLPSLQCTTV
jgi:Glutathione peroxidase